MIQNYGKEAPVISLRTFIHETAVIIGRVEIADFVNIWPGVVIRGDVNRISIGEMTNIQDNSVIHVAEEYPAVIGNNVTVGHAAVIHASEIGDNCLIGMGATVLDGARIGRDSVIGANALVPKNMSVPPGSMVLGMPAKVVRALSDGEKRMLTDSAEHYWKLAMEYKETKSI